MARFLIEVPHEKEVVACARAIKVLQSTGSHFLTNAEYGCRDGDHRGWIIVDVESREAARAILPPIYRSQAHIVALCRFSVEELDALIEKHEKPGGGTSRVTGAGFGPPVHS